MRLFLTLLIKSHFNPRNFLSHVSFSSYTARILTYTLFPINEFYIKKLYFIYNIIKTQGYIK